MEFLNDSAKNYRETETAEADDKTEPVEWVRDDNGNEMPVYCFQGNTARHCVKRFGEIDIFP